MFSETSFSSIGAAIARSSLVSSPSPDGEAAGNAAQDSVANASFAWSDLIPAAVILGVSIAVGLVLRYVVQKIVDRNSAILGRLAGRFAMFVVVSIGTVYALANLGITIGPLVGALGIGGFALAFALRDTLENLISGVILQVRQPFDYDDLVEICGFSGTVTDIDLRAVSMTTFDGEHVIIPSSDVLQNPIENWTHHPTRRINVPFGVSYDVDVERACEVVADGLRDVDDGLDEPAPDCVFAGFGDSSIDLVARVWYRSDGPYFDVLRRTAQSVQTSLADAEIDMPFPTRTLLAPTLTERLAERGDGDPPTPDPDDRRDDEVDETG